MIVISIAANLIWLEQGGQVYCAFHFSKGSLHQMSSVRLSFFNVVTIEKMAISQQPLRVENSKKVLAILDELF